METRNAKLIINKSGGTASEKSKTYRVTIPNSWVEQLGISEDNREIELSFDGSEITVRRKQTMKEYKDTHNRNKLLQLQFYHGDSLCTTILADETAEKVLIENHTSDPLYTAFGVNNNPDWQDYQNFLEERCIPKSRAGLQEYLNAIGVDEYHPLEIIRKTKGRMAEDQSWLEVTEL
jgi:bifunctional DNA-binding transcriptional regulator/antitoxin component of YhaV-PrlF toxin-antitoxin module